MIFEKAQFVVSLAGRDKNQMFLIKDVVDEAYVLLINGKNRKLETPKKKKGKHLKLIPGEDVRLIEKIKNDEKITNAEVRRALSEFEKKLNASGLKEGE